MHSRIASNRSRSSAAVMSTPDVDVRLELHALGHHLFQPAVENVFFQLEVGDAVAQQSAQPIVLLEHDHLVPLAGQLLRGGQPGRPRADDGHSLAGLLLRPQRLDPILGERPLGNLVLDLLDVHRPDRSGPACKRPRTARDTPGR